MSNDFINHLMDCESCCGGVGRYCAVGNALKIDCDAEWYVSSLVKLNTKPEREAYMKKFCPKYFDMPALKSAITEKYLAIKKMEKVD